MSANSERRPWWQKKYGVLMHYRINGVEKAPQEYISTHFTRWRAKQAVAMLEGIVGRVGSPPAGTEMFYEVVTL